MSRALWENDSLVEPLTAKTPMNRLGEAADVGDVIGFLCAPESRFISGALIPVDDGYTIAG